MTSWGAQTPEGLAGLLPVVGMESEEVDIAADGDGMAATLPLVGAGDEVRVPSAVPSCSA